VLDGAPLDREREPAVELEAHRWEPVGVRHDRVLPPPEKPRSLDVARPRQGDGKVSAATVGTVGDVGTRETRGVP
jgi:hypothetical protein